MITHSGDKVQLAGPLTQQTVKALFDRGLEMAGKSVLEVDLSQVDVVDSSGVSLMLTWLRQAQRNNVNLRFSHIPDNLMSLARLYGVAAMLPLSGDIAA